MYRHSPLSPALLRQMDERHLLRRAAELASSDRLAPRWLADPLRDRQDSSQPMATVEELEKLLLWMEAQEPACGWCITTARVQECSRELGHLYEGVARAMILQRWAAHHGDADVRTPAQT